MDGAKGDVFIAAAPATKRIADAVEPTVTTIANKEVKRSSSTGFGVARRAPTLYFKILYIFVTLRICFRRINVIAHRLRYPSPAT